MEGELARTILSTPGVKAARVHIAHERNASFARRGAEPKAVVTVTMGRGALNVAQANSIRYLVASSVPGLPAEQVAILDSTRGVILSPGKADAVFEGQSVAGDREKKLEEDVLNILEARVGAGNARVQVMLEIDTEREAISERVYDPEGRVISGKETTEVTERSSGANSGAVTVASNLPEGDANAGGSQSNSERTQTDETISYDLSEIRREREKAPGATKRLSVAVLVNHLEEEGADGDSTLTPRSDAELAQLRELVAMAVGFNEERGDTLTVQNMPFKPIVNEGTTVEESFVSDFMDRHLMTSIQIAVLSIVTLILGLFVVKPVLSVKALPASEPDMLASASAEGEEPATLTAAEPPDAIEALKGLASEKTDETATLIKAWLEEDALGAILHKTLPTLAQKGFAEEAVAAVVKHIDMDNCGSLLVKTSPECVDELTAAFAALGDEERFCIEADAAFAGSMVTASWERAGLEMNIEAGEEAPVLERRDGGDQNMLKRAIFSVPIEVTVSVGAARPLIGELLDMKRNHLLFGVIIFAALLAGGVFDVALAQEAVDEAVFSGGLSARVIQLFALVTILSIAPGIAMMVTCLPFMIIVFSILRQAIGLQQAPPNMLIMSLALFLTYFVMQPVFSEAWQNGVQPLLDGDVTEEQAFERTLTPFRFFMEGRVSPIAVETLSEAAAGERIEQSAEGQTPLSILIPAFMLSEIQHAFEIGFVIFLPFLIIDLIVASILMAMGMMMVPPAIVSLPFKLAFFVLANGIRNMTSSNDRLALGNALPMPDLRPAARAASDGPRQQNLTPKTLSAAQKAALVIAALGPEAAGPIIERIEDKHLRAFARAYAHLQSVPKAALKIVVEEFIGRLGTEESEDLKGGVESTQELLNQFIDEGDVVRLMDDINAPGSQSVWEKLDRTGDESLADYLSAQNPQLVAVVLSKINTEKASRILDIFDDDVAQKIVMRLAKPMDISEEVLNVLSQTIERDFLAPQRKAPEKTHNPGEMIGAMMNNVMSEKRDKLLAYISDTTPEIMTDVKKSLLTFQDVAERVPPNAITMVIKEIDLDLFLQAAKYGRENAASSVEFIFNNISQRMRQQYEEQMETLKPISPKEAEAAQAAFMTIVRKLVADGEIELNEIEEEDNEADVADGDSDES
ncbi:Flagellar biosynthetic protein FliP [Durusdinium trenchii]|uniref:Flagellar biosynthetic protein FliP n=1 Tax=Durusdinium trenchii TaxID=1381693 RepID=A0ABP0LJX4_9DINO